MWGKLPQRTLTTDGCAVAILADEIPERDRGRFAVAERFLSVSDGGDDARWRRRAVLGRRAARNAVASPCRAISDPSLREFACAAGVFDGLTSSAACMRSLLSLPASPDGPCIWPMVTL